MATVSDIVTGALRRIGATPIGQPPAADDAAQGLDAYNSLMAHQVLKGYIASFTTQGLGDTFPLDEGYENAAKAAVGVHVAGDFGLQPGGGVIFDAGQFEALLALAVNVPTETTPFERGLWTIRPGSGIVWP